MFLEFLKVSLRATTTKTITKAMDDFSKEQKRTWIVINLDEIFKSRHRGR